MHPAIIIGTVRSLIILWTWLWGRYHVPQNVFLVYLFKKRWENKNVKKRKNVTRINKHKIFGFESYCSILIRKLPITGSCGSNFDAV